MVLHRESEIVAQQVKTLAWQVHGQVVCCHKVRNIN